MRTPRDENEIGTGWAAAIVVLLVLLVVGLVLYLRLSAPLRDSGRERPAARSRAVRPGAPCVPVALRLFDVAT